MVIVRNAGTVGALIDGAARGETHCERLPRCNDFTPTLRRLRPQFDAPKTTCRAAATWRLRRSTAPLRPHSSIPVSNILTLTSSDRLVQQSNGVITREVKATHRLRRRSIVTCDDCIAIKADEVFVLWVHRRSATPLLPSRFRSRRHRSVLRSPRPLSMGGANIDDLLKRPGRDHHSKSNNATDAGPMLAMATAMTAVAVLSASRCIAPCPTLHEWITLLAPHRLRPSCPTRRNTPPPQ
jgi:hypothetical protein